MAQQVEPMTVAEALEIVRDVCRANRVKATVDTSPTAVAVQVKDASDELCKSLERQIRSQLKPPFSGLTVLPS
jgi:hypothetical protein